jgi:RNA recognition motif-containing protein
VFASFLINLVLTPQQIEKMMPLVPHPFPKSAGRKSSACEIFVGDLSFFCQEQDLLNLFSNFTDVQNIRIIRNGLRKRSLTFGFVELATPQQARDAMNLFDGHLFMGRNLK